MEKFIKPLTATLAAITLALSYSTYHFYQESVLTDEEKYSLTVGQLDIVMSETVVPLTARIQILEAENEQLKTRVEILTDPNFNPTAAEMPR